MARNRTRKLRRSNLLLQNDGEEEEEEEEQENDDSDVDDNTKRPTFASTPSHKVAETFRAKATGLNEGASAASSTHAEDTFTPVKRNLDDSFNSQPSSRKSKSSRKDPPSTKNKINGNIKGQSLFESLQKEAMETTNDQGCVGGIEEIKLQNFMCHTNLHLKFEKGVNFLIGLNGSGKSSICSAIQLAFGGKSSSTGRSSNFRDVIREGSDGCAIIYVQLYNEGPLAFRPELFGDRIGVQRRLIAQALGSVRNELRLYSKDGKLVKTDQETPKKLLEDLKRDTSISVDNPANIITQEKMKDFVNASHEQLYDFFMKACRLSQIYQNVQNSWQDLQEAKDRLEGEDSKEKLEELQSKYEEALRRMKEIERVQRIDEHVKEAEANVMWAKYNEASDELNELEKHVIKSDEKLKKKERTVKRKEEAVAELIEEVKAKEDEHAEAEHKLNTIQDELRLAANTKSACLRNLSDVKRNLKCRKQDVQLKRAEVNRLENEIASLESSDQREELKRLREKRNQVREKFSERYQVCRDKVKECAEFVEEIENKKEERDSALTELKACKEKQNKCDLYLEGLSRSRTEQESLKVYSDQIKKMFRLIQENRHQFHVVPVGPCGMYLELKSEAENYHMAVETGFGRLISSFLVDNHDDGKKFRELMTSHNLRVDYTVLQKLPKPSTSVLDPKSPDESYRHFLSLIKVDDDWVFNALCEIHNLHQVLVCDDMDEAQAICRQRDRENMPQNCSRIYLADGSQYSNYGGNEHKQPCYAKQPKFINVSVDQKVEDVKEELKVLEDSQKGTQKDLDKLEHELKEKKSKLEDLREEKKQVAEEAHKLKDEAKELKQKINKIESELSSESEELSNKQEELMNAKRGLAKVQQELEDLQSQKEQCQQDVDDAMKRVQRLQDDTPDQSRLSALAREIKAVEQRCHEAHNKLKLTRRYRSKQKEENDKFHEEFASVRKRVIDLKEDAQEQSGRDEPPDNSLGVEAANRELERVQKEKEQIENDFQKRNINAREIKEHYEHTREEYESALATHERLKQLVTRLENGRFTRTKQWKDHRQSKANAVAEEFKDIMRGRGTYGQLSFDHQRDEKGKIVVSVIPDSPFRKKETQQSLASLQSSQMLSSQAENGGPSQMSQTPSGQLCDLGTLSGGEKSYTTLALLGAFDTVIECPFRIMDEFDVYMDDTTRRLAVNTLLKLARDKKRQYIFLTPHDVSGALGKGENANVIAMKSSRDNAQ